MYLEVKNIDYTKYIQEKTYNVEEHDEYEEWEDLNHKKHHSLKRTRVRGSMELAFVSKDSNAYRAFYNNIRSSTSPTEIKTYVLTTGLMRTINAFVTVKHKKKLNGNDNYKVDIISLEFEEV